MEGKSLPFTPIILRLVQQTLICFRSARNPYMENVLEAFRCMMKYPELSDVPISTGLLIGFHDFNTLSESAEAE
jgi:hypothetical protein